MTKSGTKSLQSTLVALLVAGATVSISCDAPASKEDLNPEGPPMVRQVLMNEQVTIDGARRNPVGFAFGTHADKYFEDDDGVVTTADTKGSQEIRIIMDELIRGNALEEVGCADGTFSRIPDGTTPDDMADCAGPVDAILNCTKVCIGPNGTAVGIADVNEDGAPDDLRMIDYNPDPDVTELGVAVICDGVPVPFDPETSFWSPSGNQTFPSNPNLNYKGLGPVIVLKPVTAIGMRSNAECTVVFRPEVVDYDGNPVCAPTGGIPSEGCSGEDTTKVVFNSEPMKAQTSTPGDGDDNVRVSEGDFISIGFTAYVDESTLSEITLTAAGAPVVIAPTAGDDPSGITIAGLGDFLPDTTYILTIGTGLKDVLGASMPAEQVITWKTRPATP